MQGLIQIGGVVEWHSGAPDAVAVVGDHMDLDNAKLGRLPFPQNSYNLLHSSAGFQARFSSNEVSTNTNFEGNRSKRDRASTPVSKVEHKVRPRLRLCRFLTIWICAPVDERP